MDSQWILRESESGPGGLLERHGKVHNIVARASNFISFIAPKNCLSQAGYGCASFSALRMFASVPHPSYNHKGLSLTQLPYTISNALQVCLSLYPIYRASSIAFAVATRDRHVLSVHVVKYFE